MPVAHPTGAPRCLAGMCFPSAAGFICRPKPLSPCLSPVLFVHAQPKPAFESCTFPFLAGGVHSQGSPAGMAASVPPSSLSVSIHSRQQGTGVFRLQCAALAPSLLPKLPAAIVIPASSPLPTTACHMLPPCSLPNAPVVPQQARPILSTAPTALSSAPKGLL